RHQALHRRLVAQRREQAQGLRGQRAPGLLAPRREASEREVTMPEIPRLNGVIKALEAGKTAFVGFSPLDVEHAVALAASNLDGVAFEMEHAPMSAPALRDALQFMLDRRQILDSGTLAPKVTPMVRIPPNGNEMNQWIAKQVLDIGVFGIIFPH